MEALVGFQPVSSIPVAAAVDEGFGPVDVLLYEELVVEEDTYADYGENKIDACA